MVVTLIMGKAPSLNSVREECKCLGSPASQLPSAQNPSRAKVHTLGRLVVNPYTGRGL